jgi:hypothetical protein
MGKGGLQVERCEEIDNRGCNNKQSETRTRQQRQEWVLFWEVVGASIVAINAAEDVP